MLFASKKGLLMGKKGPFFEAKENQKKPLEVVEEHDDLATCQVPILLPWRFAHQDSGKGELL